MTTVEALKELYVELGGDEDDVENISLIPDMIAAITGAIKATGGMLPAVSATDNGSVLKVADGEWGVGTDAVG